MTDDSEICVRTADGFIEALVPSLVFIEAVVPGPPGGIEIDEEAFIVLF